MGKKNNFVASLLLSFFIGLLMTGCGEKPSTHSNEELPEYLAAYQRCIEQIMEDSQIKNKGKIPPEVNRQLAEAACKLIKTECEKDPDGQICQTLIEKYNGK